MTALLAAALSGIMVYLSQGYGDVWVLVWFAPGDGAPVAPRSEIALYVCAALLFTGMIIGAGTDNPDIADLFFPLLIWAAVRYGVRGTVSTLLGVMAIAVTATVDIAGNRWDLLGD